MEAGDYTYTGRGRDRQGNRKRIAPGAGTGPQTKACLIMRGVGEGIRKEGTPKPI